jgi:DNA-binding transcriptional ArsR family regulator
VLDALRAARELTHHDGRKLAAQEKNLLSALARYWPNVHPGADALTRDTGMSRGQVFEWLRRLEACGLVTSRQRGRGRSRARALVAGRGAVLDVAAACALTPRATATPRRGPGRLAVRPAGLLEPSRVLVHTREPS